MVLGDRRVGGEVTDGLWMDSVKYACNQKTGGGGTRDEEIRSREEEFVVPALLVLLP